MKYIDHGNGGGPEVLVLAEGELPEVGAGEVLIRVAWAGVNRPDVAQRQGRYPPPADASPYIGLEVSGRAAASCSVTPFGIGRTWPAGAVTYSA